MLYAGIAASATATPASAFDFRITDGTWAGIDTDVWASCAFGGIDGKPCSARAYTSVTLNHRLSDGTTIGASGTAEFFSARDSNLDNLGDEASADIYTAIVYATGVWGDILYGKTFGAVTELIDIAPSAIGLDYSVNTPFLIHVARPRLAPRSPTASPDFRQPYERFGYYSADYDGFRLGMTYADSIETAAGPDLFTVQSKHAIDVALVWSGTLGNVRLRTTGGYEQAAADVVPVNATTAADQNHWVVGGTLWWHGWCIGGNYAYTENTLGLKYLNNESYQYGVMYSYGSWAVSASQGTSTNLYDRDNRDVNLNPTGSSGNASMEMTELAASYWLDKDVKLSVAGVNVKYHDNVVIPGVAGFTAPVSNEGTYGVVQLYFHF